MTPEEVNRRKDFADDMKKKALDARKAYQDAACELLAEQLAAQGIKIGDKVRITYGEWRYSGGGEKKTKDAILAGVIFEYSNATPHLVKIKKDGTASSVSAGGLSYKDTMEKLS